jgi:hypothetical protein
MLMTSPMMMAGLAAKSRLMHLWLHGGRRRQDKMRLQE